MPTIKNIDITPGGSTPIIHVSQGDIGRQIKVNIKDGSDHFDLSGYTAKVAGTKPSGLGYSLDGVVSGHEVTIVTTAEMTDESGSILSEIRIKSGNTTIGTANFILAVERNPHPDGTTDGSADALVPAITLLVERVEAAVAKEEVLHEAEAWAVGQRDGVDVDEEDDTYHNNAKYYAEEAEASQTAAASSERNAAASAVWAADSKDVVENAKTAAEAAQTAAEAAAQQASNTFQLAGSTSFSVDPTTKKVTMHITISE